MILLLNLNRIRLSFLKVKINLDYNNEQNYIRNMEPRNAQ